MKNIKVVEFSSFDGSIADCIQMVIDTKILYGKTLNAIGIQSITMGIQYIDNSYGPVPYTLAIVVFELGDEV